MFRLSVHPPKVDDKDVVRGSSPTSRSKHFKFSLPSPLLLTVILVFVVLPMVWPETDAPALSPAARSVFNLSADVTSLTISADAEHMAATCRNRPLWVWFQGREVTWDETLLPEHLPGGTRSLALSPDGKTLAAGNVDGTVSLWDTATGKDRSDLRAGNEMILALVFSSDGTRLACSSTDARIHVWELATHRLQATLEGHQGPVTSLAFSPNGHVLVSGADDHTVRLWDAELAREIAVLRGHSDVVLAVSMSPDGELVASTSLSDRGIRLWDVQKKECRAILRGEVATFTSMAFVRDSHTLVTGDEHGSVRFWDVDSLKQKTVFPAHEGWVKGLAVSATAETLVTGGNDGLVKVWDLAEVTADHHRRP